MKTPEQILDDAIEQYKPGSIFSLFSGGHDSLTCTHWAASHLGDRLTGVVHINTGIGIPETRQFVRDVCRDYGWPLMEYKATENTKADGTPDPMIYEDIVKRYGFPGPGQHRAMYIQLKERQLVRLVRDYRERGPVMLVTGVRKQESSRRMGTVDEVKIEGRRVWVAPFAYMTALDCTDYIEKHKLPRNPVKDYLHMSGECLCGAFAHEGELKEIELWYPETAAEIKRIQAEVTKKYPWGWEDKPPAWYTRRAEAIASGQTDFLGGEYDDEVAAIREALCTGCGKAFEEGRT